MANSKRFVVKNGLETQNIQFVTADGTERIIATVLEDGTLSFSGTSGQLFSIVDSLTGSIFSVNDISGIPSIEVFDDGKVILAESTGNVGIGTITPTEKLHVAGNINIPTGSTYKINGVNLSASNVGAEPANANIQSHISSTSNPHSVTKTQVGLGNVDNTSDASKPVSTATQTALNLKANLAGPTFTGTVSGITASMVGLGNVTNESKATMFTSPTFTGTPVAPTATSGTNTTQVATTAFVGTAVSSKIDLTQKGAVNGVADLDAQGKIKVAQLPNSVFDSLYFYSIVTENKTLAILADEARVDAAATNRSSLGYYWVSNQLRNIPANESIATQIGSFYYQTVYTPGDEGQVSAVGGVFLEAGDWIIITKITGAGTEASPFIVTFAVVNNTYENASTTVDGIVRLSSATTYASLSGNNVITDGRLKTVIDNASFAGSAHTHLLVAGATDVTATASELNVLDGITATTAELNFTDGVTSAIQTQLNGTVKTTGDQSIAGTKTFTGNVNIGGTLDLTNTGVIGALDMSNNSIVGVNNIVINDPGPSEGIQWAGGNAWAIYESPNNLTTNSGGNLQIVQNTTRRATFNTSGQIEIPVATGISPFAITSTTAVTNLNADLLDGNHASAFYLATNPSGYTTNTGTVTSVGITAGTGISVANSPITTSGSITVTNSAPNATHTGDVTGATALTITNDAVTFAKMQNIDSARILGRVTASPGDTESLTAAQVRTLLNVADGATANTGTVTSVSAGTQISGMAMTITDGTTTPSIATSITNAANFRTAIGAGTGNGTVTAVTGTAPIASSGGTTPAISLSANYGDTLNPYASKTANFFLASPNGAAGAPTFRAIVVADIPTLNQNTTGTSAGVVRTVAGTTSAELVRGNMADNDQFRILVGGTSSNAGFAEIATADDGTEPIHVRQYTGLFTTLTRTATLLDGSGNTSFPGKLGIGTTTPAEKLAVEGDAYVRDRLRVGLISTGIDSIYLENGQNSVDGGGGLYHNSGDQVIANFTTSTGNTYNYANGNLRFFENTNTLDLIGNLNVKGNIVNTGSTVTVNSTTLTVTDKNIELGVITPKTGLVATLATGTANITLTTGTTEGMIPGQALTKTSGTGVFGASARIATITSLTTLTATVNHATAGSITFTASGETNFTADGGGITLKGDNDHRIEWNRSLFGGNGGWTFPNERLYFLNEETGGDKLLIEDTDMEEGSLVNIRSNSALPNDVGVSLLNIDYQGTTTATEAFVKGISSYVQATPTSGTDSAAYGGFFTSIGASVNYGINSTANATTSGSTAYGLVASASGVSGTNVFGVFSDVVSGASTSKYTFFGNGGTLYNSGSVGIGTTAPLNKLDIRVTGADSNDGIMISRADATTTTNEILGGIGFDSTDGNVPSSILEASAYIAAFAAEDHSTGDKGGYLTFGTAPIDQDDDTVSSERMRITSQGLIGIGTNNPQVPFHVNGESLFVGSSFFEPTGSGGNRLYIGNAGIFGATEMGLYENSGDATLAVYNPANGFMYYGNGQIVADVGAGNIGIGVGASTPSAKLDVVGSVKHTGLTMTSGTNVDQLKETTFTSALTTSWTDVTGVSGTYLATGSHIVQIISNGEYYTGTLSWFSGTTTSTVADEIVLHRAGPAASAGRIFARVIRTSSAPSTLKLQVSGSTSISSHTMTFKFRRTI